MSIVVIGPRKVVDFGRVRFHPERMFTGTFKMTMGFKMFKFVSTTSHHGTPYGKQRACKD